MRGNAGSCQRGGILLSRVIIRSIALGGVGEARGAWFGTRAIVLLVIWGELLSSTCFVAATGRHSRDLLGMLARKCAIGFPHWFRLNASTFLNFQNSQSPKNN